MANFAFRKRDETARDFINDCVEQAHSVRKELEPQWYENWSNYRVESFYSARYPDKQYPMASTGYNRFDLSPINFLKTPESHQGINTLRALLLASLFGTRDYVQADPNGDEDVESAKRVSRLVMYGLERPGNFRTDWEVLGDGLIFGLGSYTARWRRDLRLVPRRFPVPDPATGAPLTDPRTGAVMSVLRNVEVPVFDDPVLETDDLFDTWFDPSANRFDQCAFKAKRFRIRDEELEVLRDDPNWDRAGIERVLEREPDDSRPLGPDSTDHPKLLTESLTLDDTKEVKKYGYYGGWMLEGMIPKEVAEEIGGIDHRGAVVLRAINGYCVQSIQSPQRNGKLQGGTITILPTGRGLYGLSPLTVVRYLQDVSDTQLILTVQALIESVYQNYVTSGDQGPNFARDLETRRPREVFTLQGDIDQLDVLPKDYTGLGISIQALNLISQTIRNAMNARDPVQGVMRQTGDTTATESQLVAASALQNTDQLAVLIERDELPVMGHQINDLFYINLDDEGKVFRRVGESETTTVKYFDIDATTDITFMGARTLLNRSAKANQFRDFANIMVSNPLTASSVDWNEFVRRYGDEAIDVKGLERLMIQDPEEIVARMQSMGLAQTIRPAQGGGAGTNGGSPAANARRSPGRGGNLGGNVPAQSAGEVS